MKKRRGAITAGELLDQLGADSAYHKTRGAQDSELAKLAEQRQREQKALLKDLASAGVTVDWVGRLCDFTEPDDRIYPVLLHHIAKPYSPWLLEGIGRAFGRRTARPIIWQTLIDLVKSNALEDAAKEGVMGAISAMAQSSDVATLTELLADTSLGSCRIYLVSNLMRSKKPEARAALLRHKDDPDLTKEITARLARSKR